MSKRTFEDPLTLIETLQKKEKRFKANWETSLQHQIKDLPEFGGIWRSLLAEAKKAIALLNT